MERCYGWGYIWKVIFWLQKRTRKERKMQRSVAGILLCCAMLCWATVAFSCSTDSDCHPAACCHSSLCVPTAEAPKCKGIVCTTDCAPFSLDCGGKCVCNEQHQCAAVLGGTGIEGMGGAGGLGPAKNKKYIYKKIKTNGPPRQH